VRQAEGEWLAILAARAAAALETARASFDAAAQAVARAEAGAVTLAVAAALPLVTTAANIGELELTYGPIREETVS